MVEKVRTKKIKEKLNVCVQRKSVSKSIKRLVSRQGPECSDFRST